MKTQKTPILEEFSRRFKQINEYMLIDGVKEAGNDPAPEEDPGGAEGAPAGPDGGMPQGGPDMGGGAPMGPDGGMPQGGPDMGGGAPMGPDGGMPQGDPNMGGGQMPPQGGEGAPAGPEGFDPQMPPEEGAPMGPDGGMGMDDPNMQQPDDEVIDVSELTDTQKDTEEEVKKLGGQFSKLMDAIKSFEAAVKSNDEKIEDLKAEMEKRNPTQIEKLSMQTAHSYPFNITPEEYWKEKEATSNYSTEDDNNGVGQGQYVITADDVNGNVNWKQIYDTLQDKDAMYNQTLRNILSF